jgi:hypothetical protein
MGPQWWGDAYLLVFIPNAANYANDAKQKWRKNQKF